jgi:hypothetical protein
MLKILNKKTLKVRERIESIITDIKSHRHSVELLDGYATGHLTLRGNLYTEGAKRYRRTKEDEKRYHWTRNNITLQIALLEKELEVLIEYGA